MIYCIKCYHQNPTELQSCEHCSTPLLLCDAFHLTRPLQDLNVIQNVRHPTVVFEAKDQHRGTFRVIKVLQSNRPEHVERFQRELAVLQELQHPGIPRNAWTFSAPIADGQSFQCLVMEKVEGEDLRDWIQERGPISQVQAIDYLKQLLAIVNLLHQNYWMHRDIKPENIMVRPNGQLVLVDFGAARSMTGTLIQKLKHGDGVTQVFSYGYSPMEQIGGCGDFRADFFALGRTIVYALTGKEPSQFKQRDGRLLWQKEAKVSAGFADVLDAMMAKEPDERLTDVKQILWRLDHLRRDQVVKWVGSKRVRWAAAIAVALGIGMFFTYPTLAYQYFLRQAIEALQDKRFEDAEVDLRKALDHQKTADAYNNLGYACEFQQKWGCATENYEKALVSLGPQGSPVTYSILYYNLGSNEDAMGRFSMAQEHFRAVLDLGGPAAPSAASDLARVLIVQVVQDEAKKAANLQEAIELATWALTQLEQGVVVGSPEQKAAVLKNRGWAYYLRGDLEAAQVDLLKAQALDPDRASSYCLMAKVLQAGGDRLELPLGEGQTSEFPTELEFWQSCWDQPALNDTLIEVNGWKNDALFELGQARE